MSITERKYRMKKSFYTVPKCKKVRVIVDSDAACECDDQYAIVHALLSQKLEVKALTAEHFGASEPKSMEASYQEMKRLVKLMELEEVLVLHGEETPLTHQIKVSDEVSEAADFIIKEALKEDSQPLFILCQGAVTNVASALRKNPEIGNKMTIIWIGGTNYPYGGYEFNTWNDIEAANIVLQSKADVWMIPAEVYSTLQVGFEELYFKVAPYGNIGKYLFEQMLEGNHRITEKLSAIMKVEKPEDYLNFPNGGSWAFGDSGAVGLLLSTNSGAYEKKSAPFIKADGSYEIRDDAKEIRYYKNLNERFILEDFYNKLAYYYAE